jgi:tryptophan synthase alpha chain
MVTRSSRLADAFARARSQRRVALIAYVVAGDPDLATTERVVAALSEAGVDCIELGIPYGDPIADGPTIARAARRALAAGTTMRDVFALVTRATRAGCAPIVYFTYANPVDRFGVERFADAAAVSGAAGALVPDVPLEETMELSAALHDRDLALPLLVAPTTPPGRAREICAASSGFVYAVSRVGVTGAKRAPDMAATAKRVAALRAATSLPIAVGFGVATAQDVRVIATFADGAIVGSALIDAIGGAAGDTAARRAATYARTLVD